MAAATAAPDIAALARYQPGAAEQERLERSQREVDWAGYADPDVWAGAWMPREGDHQEMIPQPEDVDEALNLLPPPQTRLECLLFALIRIGLTDDEMLQRLQRQAPIPMRPYEELRRQQKASRERVRTRVAATFVAGSLNLNDVELLESLEQTHRAWKAVVVPSGLPHGDQSVRSVPSYYRREDQHERATVAEPATARTEHPELLAHAIVSDVEVESVRAVQEATRLECWLLVDDWLSLTGRVRRRTDDPMIDMRRGSVVVHVQKLNRLLDGLHRPGDSEWYSGGSSSTSDNAIDWGKIQSRLNMLRTDLGELLQLLHGAFGVGAAMNNR